MANSLLIFIIVEVMPIEHLNGCQIICEIRCKINLERTIGKPNISLKTSDLKIHTIQLGVVFYNGCLTKYITHGHGCNRSS